MTVTIALLALVAFRATYFFARDIIMQPLRNWLADKGRFVLLDMTECFWCQGTYWSFIGAVVLIFAEQTSLKDAALFWVATAVGIGFAGAILKQLEKD